MSAREPFRRRYGVRIDDINYGGHLGNERALVIFQDARIAFLKSMDRAERDVGEGLGVILVEAGVRYKKEVFLDDALVTEVTVGNLKSSAFDLRFRTLREASGEEVLDGFTRMLSFDYAGRKVRPIPPAFRAALEKHCTG